MAKAYITFSLPEDHKSDQIQVFEAHEREGEYILHKTSDYQYGVHKVEVEIDETRWYRLRFLNSGEGTTGPMSSPVYGGTYSNATPVIFVSSATDGANYATTQDVYDYSGLTPQEASEGQVSRALRHARAKIDYRIDEMGKDRFLTFDNEVRRRKYNATLHIIQEAEICIALGNLYNNLSDDLILRSMRDDDSSSPNSISLGGTQISGGTLAERSDSILMLATLSDKYTQKGEQLLSSLDPMTVPLVSYQDYVRSPRFKYPFHGWPQ